MNVTKKILKKITDTLIEHCCGLLITLVVPASAIIFFWGVIKTWLLLSITIPIFLIPLTIILHSAVLFFGIRFYFSPRKKIVNRIAVDKNGECYCPSCNTYLNIIQDPKYVGERVFFCNKCSSVRHPYLESGKYIGAPEFCIFQKEKPQTVYTSEIAHLRVNENLKKMGL